MDSITKALIFVLSLDLVLFIAQMSAASIAAEMGMPFNLTFLNVEGSIISQADAGGYMLDTNGTENKLLDTTQPVDVDTGTFFTDATAGIKSWLVDNVPGLKYLIMITGAPYFFVKALNPPVWFSFAIGAMWYSLTLFLIVMLIAGRNN